MDQKKKIRGCANCRISRRGFLLTGGAAAAAGILAAPGALHASAASGKLRLRVVYALHAIKQPKPDWPNLGFDFAPVMERINNTLANAFPQTEFLHSTAKGPAQANNIVFKDAFSKIDGYIVVQLNTGNLVAPSIAASGKPVLFTRLQYAGTGGFLIFN